MRTGRSVKDGSSNFDEAVALPLIVQHIKLFKCLCSTSSPVSVCAPTVCVKHNELSCQLSGFLLHAVRERITAVQSCLLVGGRPIVSGSCQQLALDIPDVQLLLPMECFVFDQRGFYTIPFLRISGKSLAANCCTLNSMANTKVLIFKPRQTSYSKCAVG